jgi:hypothetical protein
LVEVANVEIESVGGMAVWFYEARNDGSRETPAKKSFEERE